MLLSERAKEGTASGSLVRRMFDEGIILKKRYGAENVFDLSLGNPIMEPPPEFVHEFKRLANNPIP
ncbi:MAG: pyridoxal phosphate-dependent aminotransferase, partial [Chloroflexota bacterium]